MHSPSNRPTEIPQQGRQGWRRITWSIAAMAAIGLALLIPHPVQAKTFHCGAGDVPCLIAAINDANANGQKNTIRLEAGTYTLTVVDNNTDGPNGLPSITSSLTIRGAGADLTILERESSAPSFRLVHIETSGDLRLDGLTLRGGGEGPGLFAGAGLFNNGGTVRLVHTTVTKNICAVCGGGTGGLYNNGGTVHTTHTVFSENDGGLSSGGGFVTTGGTVTITQTTFARNRAQGSAGLAVGGGTVTITQSTFVDNNGEGLGGAGLAVGGGTVTITQSTFVDNFASFSGDAGGIVNGVGGC